MALAAIAATLSDAAAAANAQLQGVSDGLRARLAAAADAGLARHPPTPPPPPNNNNNPSPTPDNPNPYRVTDITWPVYFFPERQVSPTSYLDPLSAYFSSFFLSILRLGREFCLAWQG